MAQSKPIRYFVAQVRVFCPRFNVVRLEFSAALGALLTRPIISFQDGASERSVFGAMKISRPRRAGSSFPSWVCSPDQMGIAWRHAASRFTSSADCGFVLCGQRPASQGEAYRNHGFLSRGLRHHLRLTTAISRLLCYLLSHFRALGRIVSQVRKSHLARIAAKAQAAAFVVLAALFANSRMELRHQ